MHVVVLRTRHDGFETALGHIAELQQGIQFHALPSDDAVQLREDAIRKPPRYAWIIPERTHRGPGIKGIRQQGSKGARDRWSDGARKQGTKAARGKEAKEQGSEAARLAH